MVDNVLGDKASVGLVAGRSLSRDRLHKDWLLDGRAVEGIRMNREGNGLFISSGLQSCPHPGGGLVFSLISPWLPGGGRVAHPSTTGWMTKLQRARKGTPIHRQNRVVDHHMAPLSRPGHPASGRWWGATSHISAVYSRSIWRRRKGGTGVASTRFDPSTRSVSREWSRSPWRGTLSRPGSLTGHKVQARDDRRTMQSDATFSSAAWLGVPGDATTSTEYLLPPSYCFNRHASHVDCG